MTGTSGRLHGLATEAVPRALLVSAAGNAAYLAFASEYDWHAGGLHLVAHGAFKPLLILNCAFLLAVLARPSDPRPQQSGHDPQHLMKWLALLTPVLVACLYGASFAVNLAHNDWTHRFNSAAHPSVASIVRYFYEPQADGFYRPLTFISLWLDHRVFGDWPAGYHFQNLILHTLNSLLVARVALALGYSGRIAALATLVFAADPASAEPVLWPGARFDLLAAFFGLIAVALGLRYVRTGSSRTLFLGAAAFVLALLSKESAFLVPLVLIVIWFSKKPAIGPAHGRWMRVVGAMVAIAAAMLVFRFSFFGGPGGYVQANGETEQFKLTAKTLTSIASNTPGLTPFALNTAGNVSLWCRAIVAAYAALTVLVAWTYRPARGDPRRWLFILLLVAALPMANIIGWIGPSLMNGRYLYAPAIWCSLLIASVLMRSTRARLVMAAWIAVTGAAAFFNVYAQAAALHQMDAAVRDVQSRCKQQGSCRCVDFVGIQEHHAGAYFFAYQLLTETQRALPGIAVTVSPGLPPLTASKPSDRLDPACLTYSWSSGTGPRRVR